MSALREALWTTEAPPRSQEACDATVRLASMQAVPGSPAAGFSWRVAWRGAVAAVCLAALLAATPQGRDAVSWAGDLVGIGEVGGPPVSEVTGRADPSRGPIVFATGTAANGEPFELFAYRSGNIGAETGQKPGTCVATRMPATDHGTGTLCFTKGPTEQRLRIHEFSVAQRSDLGVLSGEVNLSAETVTVDYTDAEADAHTLDATVADLSGELGERIAIPNPTSFFVAFLPGVTDNLDDLCSYGITVTATDGEGGLVGTDELNEPCQADDAARDLEALESGGN